MKRWGWIAGILLLAVGVTAQTLDQPVATIKLDKKSSLVGQKLFRERVAAVEASQGQGAKLDLETKKALLDEMVLGELIKMDMDCLLYTSPSPRDRQKSRMPSSA